MTELSLEIDCAAVQQRLQTGDEFLLLDCRESEEHAIGVIEGACLLPMSELQERQQELAGREGDGIVVYCHLGMRSAQVATWLRQQGFSRAQSMTGGVEQWSLQIDPAVARY